MTEAINHTRMVAFRRCRRFHRYAYWDGIRSIKKTLSLLFGEAWHAWLESWLYTRRLAQDGLLPNELTWVPPSDPSYMAELVDEVGVEPYVSHWLPVEKLQATDPYESARFRALALAYHLRWRKQDWRVLAVERKYETPLVNPETGETSDWAHRDGRIDAIVEIDGEQMLVESKSHEGPLKPGDPYFTKLRMDSQLSHYWIGAKSLGFEPDGIIYDVACKPSLDPLKATPEAKRKYTKGSCDEPPRLYANQRDRDETTGEYGMRCFQELVGNPDSYFHRVKVVRLEHEMHEYMVSDWQTVEQMRLERDLGYFPMNTDACWMFGRACDAHPICSGMSDPTDETLYTIRTRR